MFPPKRCNGARTLQTADAVFTKTGLAHAKAFSVAGGVTPICPRHGGPIEQALLFPTLSPGRC